MDFLAIITLVSAVLQIILFFKIWVMTTNVSKIKTSVVGEDDWLEEIKRNILLTKHDEAFYLICSTIYRYYKYCGFTEKDGYVKQMFQLAKDINKELPDYLLTYSAFETYMAKLGKVEEKKVIKENQDNTPKGFFEG